MLGRVHIKWKTGLDRYDESLSPITLCPQTRTIKYQKTDRIWITIPLDSLAFYEFAEVEQSTTPDIRLQPPKPLPPPAPRDPEMDWPVDTRF